MKRSVNGRKLPLRFGLLRNSTILLRKNLDSDSARRRLPKRRESLSSGLIVLDPLPAKALFVLSLLCYFIRF